MSGPLGGASAMTPEERAALVDALTEATVLYGEVFVRIFRTERGAVFVEVLDPADVILTSRGDDGDGS